MATTPDISDSKISTTGGNTSGQQASPRIPHYALTIILAIITGTLCGLAASLFKWMISEIASLFQPHITEGRINWWIIAVPVCGILVTGILTRYVFRTNLTHGVSQLISDLNRKAYRIRHNIVISPILCSSVTLGMGGTSGSEGPIAYAGAAIGSNLGQLLRLPPQMLKLLLGCGTSAGIAGIFMAPVGGMLFGIELMRIEISSIAVTAVLAACFSSYLAASACTGFLPDMAFNVADTPLPWDLMPVVVMQGLFCGIYSIYYSFVIARLDSFFRKISNPWLSNITGGLMIGLILLLFPALYCVGYPVIGDILNGHPEAIIHGSPLSGAMSGDSIMILASLGILALKCFGVGATNSSGGVGGDFAPTLFAGSIAGFLFTLISNHYLGLGLSSTTFAYLGMAGVMAGTIEAPLMTIFIVLEMTGTFNYSLPVAIVAMISFMTVRGAAMLSGKHHHRLIRHLGWFTAFEEKYGFGNSRK